MEKIYNKLVRDNIPNIIQADKNEAVTRILGDEEYRKCLIQKLNEEVKEFTEDKNIEELCDILEVVDALKSAFRFADEDIKKTKEAKNLKNGGFEKKIFLEKVVIKD